MAAAWRELGIPAQRLTPPEAMHELRAGDVAVGRIDVRATLDGVEPGLDLLRALRRVGVRIVNSPAALRATHDKLQTARLLSRARIPHPHTLRLDATAAGVPLATPFVLKPRFGSWGQDVVLCTTTGEAEAALEAVYDRPWFRSGGAVVQTYVPHNADLRMVVAGRRVVGAIRRRPRPGDWRTNFSLGGSREPLVPQPAAIRLAVAAAAAVQGDLVGVDLIARPEGLLVLELNGAVDFDRLYSLPGRDAYVDTANALQLPVLHRAAAVARGTVSSTE